MSDKVTIIEVGDLELLEETPFDKEFREEAQRERKRKMEYRVSSAPVNKLANAINECNSAIGKCDTVVENTKDALSLSAKKLKRIQRTGQDGTSKSMQVRASIKSKSNLLNETKETRKKLKKRLKYLLDLQQKIDEL